MYGLVNKAIQELVSESFGTDTWSEIKVKAGVSQEAFISNQAYSDTITYDLVAAAAEVLETPADQVLRAFGEHWVLNTAARGYGDLMDAAGDNLVEFLTYLPNFHARVNLIFPELIPPSFEVEDVTDESLTLHYHSERPGLQDFVVGLVQGLGKRFNTPTTCTHLRGKAEGEDHDIFEVSWEKPE